MAVSDRLSGVNSSLAVKAPVRVATTANITLSGLQTIDSVTVAAGDRVLVKNQSTTSENGIYDVSANAWTRAKDFDGVRDIVQGTVIVVNAGTTFGDTFWKVATSSPVIGSALTFERISSDAQDAVDAAADSAASAAAAAQSLIDVQQAETDALAAITAQQTTSVNAVSSQQTTSVNAVVTQQNTSVAAVVTQQNTSIGLVEDEGDDQVARVQATQGQGFSTYIDTTAGLAATSSGDYFGVMGTGDTAIDVYLDNAGVAVLKNTVWSARGSRDQFRLGRARFETEVGAGLRDYPAEKLRATAWTLTNVTRNADGTFTAGTGGGTMVSPQLNTSNGYDPAFISPTTPCYCYVVEREGGPDKVTILAEWNSVTIFAAANTTTQPKPGVYRQVWTNTYDGGSNARAYARLTIAIAEAATIYDPEVYIADSTYLPAIKRYTDLIAPVSPPVRHLDYRHFDSSDRHARHMAERQVTIAVDSVTGSSGNAGTLFAPKATTAQTLAAGSIMGLYRNGSWRETLPSPAALNGIVFQDIALGKIGKLPKISALDEVVNGSVVDLGDGSFEYTWTAQATVANDGYQNVYMNEINTATEAASPIGSEVRMPLAASSAAVPSTDGSSFITSLGSNQWKSRFRPSDGLAPGSGSYRYEVVARFTCVDWANYAGSGALAGLHLSGASYGYGSIGGPKAFFGDRLLITHASTHGAVVLGGTLQRSIVYGKGDDDNIGWVFYNADGSGLRWAARDCLFYNSKPAGIYAHTAGGAGTEFDYGVIEGCAFISARNAAGGLTDVGSSGGMSAANTDYVLVRRNYVKGYARPFALGSGVVECIVEENVGREVGYMGCGHITRNNIVQVENLSDPGSVNRRGMACLQTFTNCTAENNLFYAKKTTNALADYTCTIYRANGENGSIPLHAGVTLQKSIFLIDNGGQLNFSGFTVASQPAGNTIDYNLYIDVSSTAMRGNSFGTATTGGDSFEDWQTITGWDANSRFVDLHDDPRGVQAIFVDPDNGDFRWANTEIARELQAWCAENGVGPNWTLGGWPDVPATVDDAVRMLEAV